MKQSIIPQQQNGVVSKPCETSLLTRLKEQGRVMTRQNTEGRTEMEQFFYDAHPISEWYNNFGADMQLEFSNKDIPLGAVTNLPNKECPGLGFFYSCYKDDAVAWLYQHIALMNFMAQAVNRLDAGQMHTMARDIINNHGDLNLGEVCVFFARVRQGKYGHFYNTVDNIQIMTWLEEFRKERIDELARYEAALNRQRAEEAERQRKAVAITKEEYLAQCRKQGKVSNFEWLEKKIAERKKKYTEEEAYRLLKEVLRKES